MFKYKNAMISMAVVAMLAACGGGGGGSNDDTPNNPPAGGSDNTVALTDADLTNPVTLAPLGVLITQGETSVDQTYTGFNSTTPRDDGSGYGLFGYAPGVDDSPIESFAIRVDPLPADVTLAADDTKTGRIAFQMNDQASVANGQTLSILIDSVSTTVTPAGVLSISVPAGSNLTVYAENEAGNKVTRTVPAADVAGLITVTAVGGGSEEYNIVLNVDAAVAAAKVGAATADAAVLASIAEFNSGAAVPFEVAFTMTNANIVTGATGDQGKVITVGDRTVAAQGGINGYIQVGTEATPETPAAPAEPVAP